MAESETETAAEYQPLEQLAPPQVAVVLGAVPSASTENVAAGEGLETLSTTVTCRPVPGSPAEPSKL